MQIYHTRRSRGEGREAHTVGIEEEGQEVMRGERGSHSRNRRGGSRGDEGGERLTQ